MVARSPQETAIAIATRHNLNVGHFLAVINCESGWVIDAEGDHNTSFGLAQLHNPVRDWGITIEQANTPEIALEIMAEAWEKGEQSRWSCYNNLY